MRKRISTYSWAAGAIGLLLLHGCLGFWSIRIHSATFDEPVHLTGGALLWKTGSGVIDRWHPPLAKLWVSLPFGFRDLNFPKELKNNDGSLQVWGGPKSSEKRVSEAFLFWSGNDADRMVHHARLMNLLLSCAVGGLLWFFLRTRWGDGPALFSLALYAFSPNILAHASLAMTDIPALFFGVCAIVGLLKFLECPRPATAMLCSALAFGAFLSKYTSGILCIAIGCLIILEALRSGRDGKAKALLFLRWGGGLWAAAMGAYFIFVPFAWPSIRMMAEFSSDKTYPSYLLGHVMAGGFFFYYPIALLVKSTPMELLVVAAAVGSWFFYKKRIPEGVRVPLLIGGAYLLALLCIRRQTGVRYALVCYPMLALAAAPLAADALRRFKRAKGLLLAGALLQAVSAFGAAPHFLSYLNEAAGGAKNGHHILVESSLDWGQELPALAEAYERAGHPEIVLSYFGTAPAEYYGMSVQHLRSMNSLQLRHINSERPALEWLAVSATHLEGVYVGRNTFAWLRERTPILSLGDNLFVYDITHDQESHQHLAELYSNAGDDETAKHEDRRVEIIAREGRGT